jgi:hypothetical protein
MLSLLINFFLVASVCHAFSGLVPLTAKDVSLMMRSGYSSADVLRELSARHFADTVDSATEKQLVQAGANQSLIDALRTGAYQASPAEIAAAKQKLVTQEEQASLAAEDSSVSEAPALNKSLPKPTSPSPAPLPSDAIYRILKDDLVDRRQGSLTHFDDEVLEHKKFFVFFFSAIWSVPGRKFTPQLVDYYNRVAPQHPEFEVIFFSADRSQFGMETYMAQSNMPWPAVAYDKLASKGLLATKFVHGLPCLILLNASGKILFNSYGGETDLGPEKALAELDKILARGDDTAVAPSR